MNRSRNNYGYYLDLAAGIADCRPRVEAVLKAEGFGILTEIDVKATIKEKLGEEVPAQLILGACNPPLAHEAMETEQDLALLLPCNVTLRELPDGGTRIGVMDVKGMMGMVGNPGLDSIGEEVSARFERVLTTLASEA
jgi:uncharacterized protein (DUF302 family)